MLRIVVADDSVLLREGLVRLVTDNGHDLVSGGMVLDPEVVSQLLVRRRSDPLKELTPRERSARIDGGGPFQRQHRPDPDARRQNRRMLAVLTYLSGG